MRARIPFLIAALALLAAVESFGATFATTNTVVKELPVDLAGSLWIDNPTGSIDVTGGDENTINVTMQRVINAADQAALKEARDAVLVSFEGDLHVRLLRTIQTVRSPRWNATINYTIHVPRSLHIKIASKAADHIRVAHMFGNVTVNAFSGLIIMDSVSGATTISTVNGRVICDYSQRPMSNLQIQAVNADIDVFAPAEAGFDWIADTIKGELLTTFSVRGGFSGTVYHGTVNSPGGPKLQTGTLMGRVLLLAKGTNQNQAHSVRQAVVGQRFSAPNDVLLQPAQKIQLPFVSGDWYFAASVAGVSVGEIRGSARVETGAGEVELGVVFGTCYVTSLGGPVNLGDIMGPLTAHTGAGDIFVRAAREGGQITTDGGTIRLLYSGGPMLLRSGGGDIIVRQASGPLDAETRSGDVTLTADPNRHTLRITGRTMQGNVILNVNPRFAFDIDATVMTSDPAANDISTDFTGLTIRREQVGSKTRIRATGKVNGGGERIELYAEEGDIHISSQVSPPITLIGPQR